MVETKSLTNPILTIFIPTYKRPKMLKRAIQSCRRQTIKNIKIVILDNASKDTTSSVVQSVIKEDSRVHYIEHSKNLGMLGNYQFGLSYVDTAFFSFLSDDDALLPEFCKTALALFEKYPEAGFCACSTAVISENQTLLGIPLDLWSREGLFSPLEAISEMVHNKYPIPTTILFQSKYISKASIDFENPTLWDVDFLIQLAFQFPIAISKEVCGIFISHTGSFTHARDFIHPLRRLLHRIERFSCMQPALQQTALIGARAHLKSTILKTLLFNLLHQKFSEAKKQTRELISTEPNIKHFIFFLSAHFFSFFPKLNFLFVMLKKIKDQSIRKHRANRKERVEKWLMQM